MANHIFHYYFIVYLSVNFLLNSLFLSNELLHILKHIGNKRGKKGFSSWREQESSGEQDLKYVLKLIKILHGITASRAEAQTLVLSV